jgi:uncharacterized protein (DUF2141 family)
MPSLHGCSYLAAVAFLSLWLADRKANTLTVPTIGLRGRPGRVALQQQTRRMGYTLRDTSSIALESADVLVNRPKP